MSSLLRRLPISRLLLACATLLLVGVAGTALAVAVGSGPKPAPKPLADAIHDALSAPKVDGLTAHVQLENHLIEGASLQEQAGGGSGAGGTGGADGNPGAGGNLITSGGSGRVWVSSDGKARLELQSEKGATQILYDGSTVKLYQAASNTMFEYTPPPRQGGAEAGSGEAGGNEANVPSVAKIQEAITRIMGHADLSGAEPTDVAGQPAYAVKISPRGNGGLVGGAELAFDATHGVPLKLAVYAKGNPTPVLALVATEVSYGPVPSSVFSLSLPEGVKTTKIAPKSDSSGSTAPRAHIDASVAGVGAVQARLPFTLQAPASLAGMSRHEVRLVEVNGHDAALVCYGEGLGGIAVIESAAGKAAGGSAGEAAGEGKGEGPAGLSLPHVSIGGAKATELPTALGTLLRFDSGGVEHILLGSVTPSVLQTAARGL
jgi:outer membrane lipoprotein-sorting protein